MLSRGHQRSLNLLRYSGNEPANTSAGRPNEVSRWLSPKFCNASKTPRAELHVKDGNDRLTPAAKSQHKSISSHAIRGLRSPGDKSTEAFSDQPTKDGESSLRPDEVSNQQSTATGAAISTPKEASPDASLKHILSTSSSSHSQGTPNAAELFHDSSSTVRSTTPPPNDMPLLYLRAPYAVQNGCHQDETGSVISDVSSAAQGSGPPPMTSSMRASQCCKCENAGHSVSPLLKCPRCSRKFHTHCAVPKIPMRNQASRIDNWVCKRCLGGNKLQSTLSVLTRTASASPQTGSVEHVDDVQQELTKMARSDLSGRSMSISHAPLLSTPALDDMTVGAPGENLFDARREPLSLCQIDSSDSIKKMKERFSPSETSPLNLRSSHLISGTKTTLGNDTGPQSKFSLPKRTEYAGTWIPSCQDPDQPISKQQTADDGQQRAERGAEQTRALANEETVTTSSSQILPQVTAAIARRLDSNGFERSKPTGADDSAPVRTSSSTADDIQRPEHSSIPKGPKAGVTNDITPAKQVTCKYWKKGYCKFDGTDCQYAHTYTGINPPKSKYLTCSFWWHNGYCCFTDEECDYAHRDTGYYAPIPGAKPLNGYRPSTQSAEMNSTRRGDHYEPSNWSNSVEDDPTLSFGSRSPEYRRFRQQSYIGGDSYRPSYRIHSERRLSEQQEHSSMSITSPASSENQQGSPNAKTLKITQSTNDNAVKKHPSKERRNERAITKLSQQHQKTSQATDVMKSIYSYQKLDPEVSSECSQQQIIIPPSPKGPGVDLDASARIHNGRQPNVESSISQDPRPSSRYSHFDLIGCQMPEINHIKPIQCQPESADSQFTIQPVHAKAVRQGASNAAFKKCSICDKRLVSPATLCTSCQKSAALAGEFGMEVNQGPSEVPGTAQITISGGLNKTSHHVVESGSPVSPTSSTAISNSLKRGFSALGGPSDDNIFIRKRTRTFKPTTISQPKSQMKGSAIDSNPGSSVEILNDMSCSPSISRARDNQDVEELLMQIEHLENQNAQKEEARKAALEKAERIEQEFADLRLQQTEKERQREKRHVVHNLSDAIDRKDQNGAKVQDVSKEHQRAKRSGHAFKPARKHSGAIRHHEKTTPVRGALAVVENENEEEHERLRISQMEASGILFESDSESEAPSKIPQPVPQRCMTRPSWQRPTTSLDLFEVMPQLRPEILLFDREAKLKEIAARPGKKQTFGKNLAGTNRTRGESFYKEIDRGYPPRVFKILVSDDSEDEIYGKVPSRKGRTKEAEMTFDEFIGNPKKAVFCMTTKTEELALRDGTRDARGRLPRIPDEAKFEISRGRYE